MKMSNLRNLVLQSFKKLHRTRLRVFNGDTRALTAARFKVNEEYKRNKQILDEEAIKAMVQFAEDVEKELRTQVIQAREVKPGVFEAKITADTAKLENIRYNPNAVPRDEETKPRPCRQGQDTQNRQTSDSNKSSIK